MYIEYIYIYIYIWNYIQTAYLRGLFSSTIFLRLPIHKRFSHLNLVVWSFEVQSANQIRAVSMVTPKWNFWFSTQNDILVNFAEIRFARVMFCFVFQRNFIKTFGEMK